LLASLRSGASVSPLGSGRTCSGIAVVAVLTNASTPGGVSK
jgi:hypothetical protein